MHIITKQKIKPLQKA